MLAGLFITLAAFGAFKDNIPNKHRVYAHLLEPREHPDYDRRHVRPPGWDTFGNRTQFTGLRGFGMQDDQIVNYVDEIEKYTCIHDLGDVIWPSYPIIFARNLGDLADEIKRRGLFLFDIWGYVPGSGPGGYWQQFKPPAGVFDMLESKLDERWLGMDVGEQDGRYVGGYASQMYPSSADRFKQYLNFQQHFQKMCDELGNKMSALVSLNFGHYFLKEGVYTLLGAETAQALPNGQVYYAFIRGAGKQYGVPWFGNASIFNRWGYKVYGSEGYGEGAYGPKKGTSLNLMKRLIYSHILYNCMLVGFESSWFEGDNLSPIGKIQQSAHRWVRENGQPGVMITPIAIMLDFFSGWSFPRHLYSGEVYRVWGNLPYEPGDYMTDGVLDMLYPGYQDSSYFHDESGFISPTPYSDSADCILSDAPGWLLERYPLLVVADELSGGAEIRDKLQVYAENGGHLILTAGNLAKFHDGLAGMKVIGKSISLTSENPVKFESKVIVEDYPFELYPVSLPDNARIIAQCGNIPAAVEVPSGKGMVTLLASPYGIHSRQATRDPVTNEVDKHLIKPYPVLKYVKLVLDEAFRKQILFDVGDGLSLIVCRKGHGDWTLGLSNNSLYERPFQIVSRCGAIESIHELQLDQSEKSAVGYLPEAYENTNVGISNEKNIAGGDFRIFSVRVKDENVELINHLMPPPRPQNRALPLRWISSIKEEVLSRSTFFEHFDSVVIDWKYLWQREEDAIRQEAGWIRRQGLRVIVDLTSGINLYTDLRLINNIEEDYSASMSAIKNVLTKMAIIGSRDLILSLHRYPENNFTGEQTMSSFEKTLCEVCKLAQELKIDVHLRMCHGKPPWNLNEAMQIIEHVGAENLFIAPGTALLLASNAKPEETAKNKIRIWLVSAPAFDIAGHLWNTHVPIAQYSQAEKLGECLAVAPDAMIVFDGIYKNQEEEYLDARAFEMTK